MDASNWINLGLFIVTALGVVAASRSAGQARSSKQEAHEFARAAIAAQERQAEAQERSAAALEASAGIAPARRAVQRFRLERETSERWRIFNNGPGSVANVRLAIEEDPSAFVEGTDLPKSDLGEGLAMTFFVARSLASPADLTLVATWQDINSGEDKEWRASV